MRKTIKSVCIGATAGFFNGLFGSGGGTIVVPAAEKYLRIETHKAHASAIAIILPLSAVSAVFYAANAETNWHAVLFVSLGGILGGVIGAKLLSRLSANWLHKTFGLFMIVAAIRMII